MKVIVASEAELRRLLHDVIDYVLKRRLSGPKESPQEPKEWLTNKEAQEFLGLSRATLQRYRDSEKLPYSKIGGNIFYCYEDIVEVLEEHRVD